MRRKRDIPTLILVTEGTNVKTGTLSILEKKGIKILGSIDWQLHHLHWLLVSYADRTYLLGYSKTLGGAKATKKLLVKGCSSSEMNLPEKVVESPNSSETYLSIRCGEKNYFLKAENRDHRDTWVDAIRGAMKEQIYSMSTVSTPDGQMTHRASPPSISSNTQALAQQNRTTQEMASVMALKSQQSTSLNSADRMGSSCQPIHEIFTKKQNRVYPTVSINEPLYDEPSSDARTFRTPRDNDDQSIMSRVDNLGLEGEGNANSPHDDTAAPELPKRSNQNPSSVVQEGLKTRAPQQPEASIDQMDSIQREKTVCLRTQFKRDHQPIEREKSDDDNEKIMRGKMNRPASKCESIHNYIERFRIELFKKDGVIVEVDKTDLSPKTIKLMCVADCICIAALPDAKLHSLLHVDDVIVKVNRQTLPSIDFCYKLFGTTDDNKVQLHVKRVVHGILCHVILSANGDVDSLGLEFGNQSQGNEVTAMQCEGLVAKSGSFFRPQTHGVVSGGMLVNWGLVEINQSPVSFHSSPAEVRYRIRRAGCELALVFIPMDIINIFKKRGCEERTYQTSEGDSTC